MRKKSDQLLRMLVSVLLSCFGVLLTMAPAHAQITPLDYAYYAKFPDNGDSKFPPPLEPAGIPPGTHLGLQHFHEHLTRMRNAQRDLRYECVGPGSRKMIARVRGEEVLIWPERFKECEAHAALLANGSQNYDIPLAAWNKIFGTNYVRPKGDPADIQAWERRRTEFLRFPQPGCDEASHGIVIGNGAESPEQVFQRAKKICPARWVRLFEPAEDASQREAKAKLRCRPGTTYFVSDEKSNGGVETCHESDKYTPDEVPSKQATAAAAAGSNKGAGAAPDDSLEAELDAIVALVDRVKGELKLPRNSQSAVAARALLAGRREAGSDLAKAVEQQVANMPSSGSFGGQQIFGGETGRMLEAALDPARAAGLLGSDGSTGVALGNAGSGPGALVGASCDDAKYQQASAAFANSQTRGLQSLSIEAGQCASARLYAEALRRDIAYAQSCNKGAALPSLQAALRDTERQQQQLCAMAQKATSASSGASVYSAPPVIRPAPKPPPPRAPTEKCRDDCRFPK